MKKFMIVLSGLFSIATVGVAVAFLGVLVFGVYKWIEKDPPTPEEVCRDWARYEYKQCRDRAVYELNGADVLKAQEHCLKSHNITKLMDQCLGKDERDGKDEVDTEGE